MNIYQTKQRKLLLVACCVGFAVQMQAATVNVSLGTIAPKNSSYHRFLLAMGQEWRNASDSTIRLKVYPSGVIGTESDMVREMRVGGIQAAFLSSAGITDIDTVVGNFQSLPMMFRNLDEFEFVYKKMQPAFEKRLEEKGFVVLFWADAGWVYFFTCQPMKTPEDLKGMKVFASANVSKTADMWRSSGFQPVSLDVSDITMGLQTGMITAVSVPPIYAMAGRIDNTAKYMLDLKWAPLIAAAVMYKDTWDRFSAADQTFLRASAQKTAQDVIKQGRDEGQESIDAMVKRGLTVNHADAAVEQQWIDMAESFYSELRGEMVTEEIFDEVRRLLKEYRTQQ